MLKILVMNSIYPVMETIAACLVTAKSCGFKVKRSLNSYTLMEW